MKTKPMYYESTLDPPDAVVELSKAQAENLARFFVKKYDEIVKFYENPENEKAFQEWYFKKYGKYPEEEQRSEAHAQPMDAG